MMRHVLAAASLLVVLAACSSSTEGDECSPAGTYSMTGEIESTTCKLPAGDSAPSTVLVEPVEAADADFTWSTGGLTGRCPLRKVGSACKYEGRCPVTITDATTANNQAEILISWTFTAGGFSGVSTLTAPPFKDNPDGCVQTVKNTATRR
jgi:type 1 fimbria pilin